MPITSMILECAHGQAGAVADAAASIPCAEIADTHAQFLVVVTDTATREEDRATMSALTGLSGVICATPVFTNREDLPAPQLDVPSPCPDETTIPAPLEV